MTTNTVTDDSKTSADHWKDWRITSLQQSEFRETNLEYTEDNEFTKHDFEKDLRKVARKIKK